MGVVHKDLKLPWRKMRIKETFVSRQNDDNTENFQELKFWREPAISPSQNKSKLPGSYRKMFGNPNAMYHHSLQSLYHLYQDAILVCVTFGLRGKRSFVEDFD